MKKILGLVIVFTLMLQSLCGVITANAVASIESSEKIVYKYDDITNDKDMVAAMLVSHLGILESDLKDDFKSTYLITRAEAAKIMIDMFKIPVGDTQNCAFLDVPPGHSYYNYIQTLVGAGLVSKAEYFRPNDYVAASEFLKMLIVGMGYEDLFRAYGEYPQNVFGLADKLYITKGLSFDANEKITKIKASRLIYNALLTPVYSIHALTEEYATYEKKDLAIYKYFGIELVEGIVTANCLSSLFMPVDKNKTYAEIDRVQFYDKNSYLAEYLGHRVLAAVDPDTSDNEILFAFPAFPEYEVFEVLPDEVASASASKIVTEIGDTEETYNIDGADILKNGVADLSFYPSDLEISDGKLELIDNNDDGKIDVVNILEPTYVVVLGTSQTDGDITIASKNNNDILIKDAKIIVGDVSSAQENDLAVLYISAGEKYVKIDIVSNQVSGVITEMDDEYVVMDGIKYKTTGYFANNPYVTPLSIGKETTFILNENNEIVWNTEASWTSDKNYIVGYIMSPDASERSNPTIRVYNSSGKFEFLSFADKVKYNNESKTKAQIEAIIKNNHSELNGKLIIYQLDANGKIKALETETNTLLPNRILVKRDVTLTTNWMRSYDAIYDQRLSHRLVSVNEDAVALRVYVYGDGTPALEEKYESNFGAGTFSSMVPNKSENVMAGNLSFYAFDKNDYASVMVVKHVVQRPTGGGGESGTDAIFNGIKSPDTSSAPYMYIDRVTTAVNADGEPIIKVRGMANNGTEYQTYSIDPEIKYIADGAGMQWREFRYGSSGPEYDAKRPRWFSESGGTVPRAFEQPLFPDYEAAFKKTLSSPDDYTDAHRTQVQAFMEAEYEEIIDNYIKPISALKPGDIIRYQLSSSVINKVELVYSYDKGEVAPYYQVGGHYYSCGQTYMRFYGGKVFLFGKMELYNDLLKFTSFDTGFVAESTGPIIRYIKPEKLTKFIVFDGKKVSAVDSKSIASYANSDYRFMIHLASGEYSTVYAVRIAD